MGRAALMGEVTTHDLRDLRDSIVNEMRAGFRGIYERQDKTNGRLNGAELVNARHDVRLSQIERRLFNRRSSDRRPPDSENKPVTRGQVLLVLGVIASAVSFLKFLEWLMPRVSG